MMKKIYYILFLLLAGFCFNSCVSEEEDLFDKSAAERMNEALTKGGFYQFHFLFLA